MARAKTMGELFLHPLRGDASDGGATAWQDMAVLVDPTGKVVAGINFDMAGEHAKAAALAINVFDPAKAAMQLALVELELRGAGVGDDTRAVDTLRATLKAMEL